MANERSISMFVRIYLDAVDKRNITIPKTVRAALDHHRTVIDTAENYDPSGKPAARAVYDALAAGKDPLNDKAVQAALAAEQVTKLGIVNSVLDMARGELTRFIRRNINELTAVFQPAYATAGERLAAAHTILKDAGVTDLADTYSISTAKLPVAQANVDARAALADLDEIWKAVSSVQVVSDSSVQTPLGINLARADAGDTPAYQILRLGHRARTFWELVDAGFTLSLATPEETMQRSEHAVLMEQQRDAQALSEIKQQPGNAAVTSARYND